LSPDADGCQTGARARGLAIVLQRRFQPAPAPLIGLLVLVGLIASTACPSRAAATPKPCWERVIDDWLDNGAIDGTYEAACYQAALKHVPEDLRDYSGIEEAIASALQSSPRGQDRTAGSVQGGGGPEGARRSGAGGESGPASGGPAVVGRTLQVVQERSYYRRAIDDLGPTSAESLPIPLLVLAGIGTALLLTAAALVACKRLRAGGEHRGSADDP